MQKRLVMTAVLAAILGGAALSAFRVPWYVASVGDDSVSLRLLDLEFSNLIVLVITLLVNVYFFVRLLFTGILVLNGGPTSTRVIAWYSPAGALFQAGASLVAAVVMYAMKPDAIDLLGEPARNERAWGGLLLVVANLAAVISIVVIWRDRVLARTQTWVDDEGVAIPKKKRWIRSAPQERPLVKPPLESPGSAGGDPFRAAPATGLEAALVKPATRVEAPRKDDDAAPAPKLLT